MENDVDQMSHRDRILELISQGVPEVKDIYQGTLTIFERMLLWDYIEKVDWVDKSKSSSVDAMQKCYRSFIQEVEKFITEEADPMTKVNMECLRSKLLNGPLKSSPADFIQEMAVMIQKENELIKQYYFDQVPIQQTFETLNIAQKDSGEILLEEVKELAEVLKSQLMASSQAEKQVLNVFGVHSPEGQQQLNKMKAQCSQIVQFCDKYFKSFFSKMEEAKVYLKDAKRLFQKKLSYDSIDLPMSGKVLSLEALDSNFQIWTSALCSVKEDIANYEKEVIQMYTKYPQAVQADLYSKLVGHKNRLGQFLSDYFQMCVVTVKCPGNQYHKSSSSSSKKDQEETEVPKKKATKTKIDKKENSVLNSTLKILGAQPFGRNLRIDANSSSVLLVDENLLPEYLPEGTELQFEPDDITKCGRLKPESPPKLNNEFELKFYREEIEEPSRSKNKTSTTNKESASVVVASFSRFWYKINVEVFDRRQTLYAVSHPIGWRTGSNQLLQFHGSLTWYHWNVDNVYENMRIPQRVPVPKVLDMLDEQIANIKDETVSGPHNTKCRSLSSSEREFLQSLLLGENSTSEFVHLKDFICNKPPDKKKRSMKDPDHKTQTFDFHTWFFALLKSLNDFMKGLWLDCLIYGICSEKTTSEILMREETPVGTIILRPSTTMVHNTRCMEPRLDLGLDFKTNRNHHEHVDNINWVPSQINHLPEAILKHGPTFKYIQGVNNRKWPVKSLKNYFRNDKRYVYRSTAFKLTISFQLITESDDQDEADSSVVDEKKMRADDFHASDSVTSFESPSHASDNQSTIITSSQQVDNEMSPAFSDSWTTSQAEGNEISPLGESSIGSEELWNTLVNQCSTELNNNIAFDTELTSLAPTFFLNGDELQDYLS